jgi:SulP family sulfate permease
MKKTSDLAEQGTTVTSLGGLYEDASWEGEKGIYNKYNKYNKEIYIKHLYGPMFFGFTSRFQELIGELDSNLKVLVIRMDRVPYIDQSGVYALEEAILELRIKGVVVLLTGIQPQPLDMLKKIDIIPDLIPNRHSFAKFDECEAWLKHNLNIEKGGFDRLVRYSLAKDIRREKIYSKKLGCWVYAKPPEKKRW